MSAILLKKSDDKNKAIPGLEPATTGATGETRDHYTTTATHTSHFLTPINCIDLEQAQSSQSWERLIQCTPTQTSEDGLPTQLSYVQMLTTDIVPHGVSNSSICCQNCHMLEERIISLEHLMSEQRNALDKVRTQLSKLSAVPGTEGVRESGDTDVATSKSPLTTQSNKRADEHQDPETWLQPKQKKSKKSRRSSIIGSNPSSSSLGASDAANTDDAQTSQTRLTVPTVSAYNRKIIKPWLEKPYTRSQCIVIHGIPETSPHAPMKGIDYDIEQTRMIIKSVLPPSSTVNIRKCLRLGKQQYGPTVSVRPMKIVFDSEAERDEVLSLKTHLRSTHPTVFFQPDQTQKEREKHRLLLAELRGRRLAGEVNLRIEGSQIVKQHRSYLWIHPVTITGSHNIL